MLARSNIRVQHGSAGGPTCLSTKQRAYSSSCQAFEFHITYFITSLFMTLGEVCRSAI